MMERSETLGRFSRAHLASPAELEVYMALERTAQGSLSAEQIAERTGLPIGEVDRVVAAFVAAGIFRAKSFLGTPVYHRRPDADYLYVAARVEAAAGGVEAEAAAKVDVEVDPVCGMRLPEGSTFTERDVDGHEVHFCSARCRAAFIAFPGLYRRTG